jgi:hypothetical protein
MPRRTKQTQPASLAALEAGLAEADRLADRFAAVSLERDQARGRLAQLEGAHAEAVQHRALSGVAGKHVENLRGQVADAERALADAEASVAVIDRRVTHHGEQLDNLRRAATDALAVGLFQRGDALATRQAEIREQQAALDRDVAELRGAWEEVAMAWRAIHSSVMVGGRAALYHDGVGLAFGADFRPLISGEPVLAIA